MASQEALGELKQIQVASFHEGPRGPGPGIRAYFSVCYYTKCALLKAGCETLKVHLCNIKVCMLPSKVFSICQLKEEN